MKAVAAYLNTQRMYFQVIIEQDDGRANAFWSEYIEDAKALDTETARFLITELFGVHAALDMTGFHAIDLPEDFVQNPVRYVTLPESSYARRN